PEPVVERNGEHAHVVGERPPVIARDDACLGRIEVLEALDGVAVVELAPAPECEPGPARDAVQDHSRSRRRIAPYEIPVPPPVSRMWSPGRTRPLRRRRCRLTGTDAAPTLPT